ncbi:transglycosylase domain-containing protein [Paraeggerthella hongkongensis]|uniref:transglycosylase domain-containing protein n=1 Tax=Paraeggerthella TaxID=651554 RepID=UPI000DF7B0A8|nr:MULTISPECIES: biosynthetic peptidoglycan transglycosylase [Paraeggerthella]MBU5405263.1 transglycosylase domain-containing protein [Paraeggerthella hongkongensis]MCD2433368.1 transglycosylase domain-containing protein [Paraeggerthella hominis]MDY3982141.1 biosynthetic peptidoglycan transglycosylase [Paraeggerthella sp.]RDB58609.1 glycosyl transferase [Paraeggerthella hongkongensis]
MTAGTLFKRSLALALILGVLATAFFAARGFNLYRTALESQSLDDMATAIESEQGFTSLDKLPDLYLQAVVAVEDHRFYAHPGFDVIATGRALVNNIKARSVVEGGSTITQQLAKNQYFTQEQTLERKLAETLMAFTMESHFSKRKILELYVNSIYFGNGYEGIGNASMGYFGKQPGQLTEDECAMLAGIPNAPSVYSPAKNPDLARQRQQEVLRKLVRYDYLDQARAQHLSARPTLSAVTPKAMTIPA